MSLPARKLPTSTPAPRTEPRRARGGATPERRPASTAHRRPKHHLGFALLASTLVGLMVLAIVVLHALLAQQSFRIDEAERRVEALSQEHLRLTTEQAILSAPGRIAAWANRHGMRLPDDIRILRAPNGSADPAGAGTLDEDEA